MDVRCSTHRQGRESRHPTTLFSGVRPPSPTGRERGRTTHATVYIVDYTQKGHIKGLTPQHTPL